MISVSIIGPLSWSSSWWWWPHVIYVAVFSSDHCWELGESFLTNFFLQNVVCIWEGAGPQFWNSNSLSFSCLLQLRLIITGCQQVFQNWKRLGAMPENHQFWRKKSQFWKSDNKNHRNWGVEIIFGTQFFSSASAIYTANIFYTNLTKISQIWPWQLLK